MTRKLAMIAALALLVVMVGLALQRHAARRAASAHVIDLATGETLRGELLTVRPGSYILQTGARTLLLDETEIRHVDGKRPEVLGSGTLDRVALVQETYEEIADSGYVEVHSQWRWQNGTGQIQDQVDWGLSEREVPQLRHYRVVDAYGNELRLRIEPDASIHGQRVFVSLVRPILPGEEGRLTLVVRQSECLSRTGEEWVYRNAGDYPDNRLVTRAVHLPAGAHLVEVQPEPLYSVETDGRPLVVWRRYFRAGERVPWEIRFRLAPGAR
jgi:hypothetical protein